MTSRNRGFTIIELLVVVSIIALLVGILLPAIGKARDNARLTQSQTNMRQMGQANATYAAEWSDRQFTCVDDNISRYGNSPATAVPNYNAVNGEHPPIILGWGAGSNGGNALWGYWMDYAGNYPLLEPIDFSDGFGWFRIPNMKQFADYLNGKFVDPIFYAPKDTVVYNLLEDCMDTPAEFVDCVGSSANVLWSSYCWSPAALYNPEVLSHEGFQNPWSLPAGLRVPAMGQARYADLKTHMLEHHWLQNRRADCNLNWAGQGTYDGCEPYYFNHAWESVPVTLFFDGHVEGMGVREAERADKRLMVQTGNDFGTWRRDAMDNGYFIDQGYDWANTSFHILTTDGILGRDKLGN